MNNESVESATDLDALNTSMRSMSLTSSSINDSNATIRSDYEHAPSDDEKGIIAPSIAQPIPQSLSELDFSGICEVVDRRNLSEEGSAQLTNAVLEMVGWITSNHSALVVTGDYIHRKMTNTRRRTWDHSVEERRSIVEHMECFSFDGKKIFNATMISNPYGDTATKRSYVHVENVVIMQHPELKPLGFISSLSGKALCVFNELNKFLNPTKSKEAFKSLFAIAADGTNTNTGATSGIIKLFEDEVNRNLHRIICLLHFNELDIKHVIFAIDGATSSEKTLKGEIGKKITQNDFIIKNIAKYEPIPLGEIPSDIDDHV